jgi:hypothetical protein
MKITLLLLALTGLTTVTYADNRNPAEQAIRFARESRQEAQNGTSNATEVQYVAVSNGKGGTLIVAQRDPSSAPMSSIALSKSGASCSSGSCSSR